MPDPLFDPPSQNRPSRREVLVALGAAVAIPRSALATSTTTPDRAPVPVQSPTWDNAYGVAVTPRSGWVPAEAPAVESLEVEPSVAVLIVHHSETSNTYAVEDVPKVLRSFRNYHMSRMKGWPDVAYNFFVDRFGGVWEGRTGSLTAPVAGGATGGNQGRSQLVCLVGNHNTVSPSDRAVASLARLLAALADHYVLPVEPDAIAEFESRGSTRWPAGVIVRTRSIEGHCAMSMTSCPGNAAFQLLPIIRAEVHRLRVATAATAR